jgi:hypothetical protein
MDKGLKFILNGRVMSRALLIGINYTNTPNQLQGCIYDIIEVKSLLIDAYGYNPNTIICLRDDDPANMPTRARILQEIRALVANATPTTKLFLHYSGHGTQLKNTAGTEIDGQDECIVPCDYLSAGFITDNEINTLVKDMKGIGLAVFDCCRSGTIMDLPFTGVDSTNQTSIEGFYCFSGCLDSQDALESMTSTHGSNTGLPQGAMTMAFISTIRTLNYYPPISTLYSAILANLQAGGYSQTPQLTSTVQTGSSTPFPFDSPNEQLALTRIQLQEQQALLHEQQVQLSQLAPQAALVPDLQTQAQTLSVLQPLYEALQMQDATNRILINTLQEQVATIPELQQQAALVPRLQYQVSIIPGIQSEMNTVVSQLKTQSSLQNTILNLQYQISDLQAQIQELQEPND